MRPEQNPRSAIKRGEAGDEIRPARFDFLQRNFRTNGLQPAGQENGDFFLTDLFGSRSVVGIHRRNPDELLEKGDNVLAHGGRIHIPLRWGKA